MAAAVAALAGRATAQSSEHPLLIFSMTGGYATGGGIWSLDRQIALVASGARDSLSLARLFRPGFEAGLGVALYRSPHIGLAAEMAFLGISTESRCSPLGPYAFDPDRVNEQACLDIQGRHVRTNAAAFQAGAIVRPWATTAVQPFLRAVGGLALLGGSFVETAGTVVMSGVGGSTGSPLRARVFLDEENRRELTWIATFSAGVTIAASPGYQVRFEVRDIVTRVPSVTGPADPQAVQPFAQVGSRTVQLLGLTVALDLALERQRTRRY